MIIQVIVILLLAERVLSSVSVQGTISIDNNDTMTMYLHTDKSSVGDNPDKILKKLYEAKSNPRIHLVVYLGERILVIESELNHHYFKTRSDTTRNIVETDMINYLTSTKQSVLKENICKILCNNNIAGIIPQLRDINQLVDNTDDLLRRIFSILETRDRRTKLTRRNIQRQSKIYPQDLIIEYPVLNLFTSDLPSENENTNSNRELEMFFAYAKSVQDHLSSFAKALEAKWQSRDHFNESIRRKLLTLQKQAEFLLDSLTGENQRYEEKTSTKHHTSLKRSESKESATSSIRREDEEKEQKNKITEERGNRTTSLPVRHNLRNESEDVPSNKETKPLNGTTVVSSFHEVYNKTQRKSENETKNENALQIGTRFLNYPKATKNIKHDFATTITTINKFYGMNNNLVASNISDATKSRNLKNFVPEIVNQETFAKLESTPVSSHRDALANGSKTQETLLDQQLTNTSASGNETILSALKRAGKQNRVKLVTEVVKHDLGINNDDYKHMSKKLVNNYHSDARVKENVDKTSAMMEEMLEAVSQVLP